MQAEINFTFDLGTAAGRSELQRLFQHMLVPTERVDLSDLPTQQPGEISDAELKELRAAGPVPARINPSSIPDDPDRAAAAKAGRQEAAAKARAAKAAKQAPEPEPEPEDLGPAGNGQDLQDQVEEDLGLDDPSMGPGEAKEQGLVLMRELYAAGKVEGVKKLQKAWGIAKFYDIPVEKGHEFYRQAMRLAVDAGLRK